MSQTFSVQDVIDSGFAFDLTFKYGGEPQTTAHSNAFSGRLLATEVTEGLFATGHEITYLEDNDLDVEVGASITCGLLLQGASSPMLVTDHASVSQSVGNPVLIGFGGEGRCRAQWRQGQICLMAGFMIQPKFFERFDDQIQDSGLAKLVDLLRQEHRVDHLVGNAALGRLASRNLAHSYTGESAQLFLEGNTLAFLVEVAALFAQIDRTTRRSNLTVRHKRLVSAACELIDSMIATPPTAVSLARAVGTNVTTLQGAFKAEFGTTIFGYIQSRRLEVAKVMLAEHLGGVSEIAKSVGYANASAFAAAYRRHFGYPPSATS